MARIVFKLFFISLFLFGCATKQKRTPKSLYQRECQAMRTLLNITNAVIMDPIERTRAMQTYNQIPESTKARCSELGF